MSAGDGDSVEDFHGFQVRASQEQHKVEVVFGDPTRGQSTLILLEPADAREVARRLNEAAEYVLHGTEPPSDDWHV